MAKMISTCPVCSNLLHVQLLQCSHCGLELKNSFEMSPFDRLDSEQIRFLLQFLRCRGNLSALQEEMHIAYPNAKNRLNDLLAALNLLPAETEALTEEDMSMNNWTIDTSSNKASEIIKAKFKEAGGRVIVHSISGKPYEIIASVDGHSFTTRALPPSTRFTYEVFDVIVDLLISQGGKAPKGLGRNARLGEPNCEETTVVGAIGKNYLGKHNGESVLDPVFVLAAILEWAGIAHNERGYLSLSAEYKSKL